MTSVLCSACVQKIHSDNDRVYCFGGCDQILHVKCSDINAAGAKALHDNVALKYVCHGCRKNMTSLNDIQNKCIGMVEQMSALASTVAELELKVTTVMKNLLENFEKKMSSEMEKTLRVNHNLTNAFPVVSTEHFSTTPSERGASYAAILAGNVNGSNRNEPVSVSPMPSGLLRSGKRRNLQVHQKTPSTSRTPLAPRNTSLRTRDESNVDKSPAVKSKAVVRIERSVSFKPKIPQHAETTKLAIQNHLDPLEFAVKEVRCKDNGEVVVRCDSKECADKMLAAATASMSEAYDVDLQKPLKPRLKISGLPENITENELVNKLKKQNDLPESAKISVNRLVKRRRMNSDTAVAYLETDSCTFDRLLKMRRVNIGWERCVIVESIDVMRCYKCCEYGHKASSCRNTFCCPKCAGDHEVKDCLNDYEKCVNCDKMNEQRSSRDDEILNVCHSAWSINCPLYQARLRNTRLRIDYST